MSEALATFLSGLDQRTESIPIQDIVQALTDLVIHFEDVERFARFSPDRYQRNLLHQGPAYQALVLCWGPKQRSPIHDHCGSACGVRVLKGVATETQFQRTTEGLVYACSSMQLREGQIIGSFDADIHQISNLQTDGRDLVTLHVYSPPLLVMNTYSLTDNTIEEYYDPIFEFSQGAGI